MTESNTASPGEKEPLDPRAKDDLLALFGLFANRMGVFFGVTLVVPGGVITGMAISKHQYLKKMAEGLSSAGEVGTSMAQLFKPKEDFKPDYSEGVFDEERPDFLHLENAQIVFGAQMTAKSVWRVRIADVSAWTLGNYAQP